MPTKTIAPIEVGSFTASSPQKTEFIGSASGVFFVNTVFRAFARSAYSSSLHDTGTLSQQNDPGSVDSRLVDPETPLQAEDESLGIRVHLEREITEDATGSYGIKGHGLGQPPDQAMARELLMLYLRNWHPLFPFLHGPTLLETIAQLYEKDGRPNSSKDSLRLRLCQTIICQCIFNITSLDWQDKSLPPESRIASPTKLLSLLGFMASNHDILSIQALIAAQLYLVSIMSLRAASTVGGTLAKVMYHAGLHRCPYRYPQVLPQECDLRKRIFWSAYALDRYLSQALGHPLGIQDSDLDVCIPGTEELHQPVSLRQATASTNLRSENEVLAHLPRTHSGRDANTEENLSSTLSEHRRNDDTGGPGFDQGNGSAGRDPSNGSEILANYVVYCRLTGQALELFHKSLQNRKINTESMIELQSEVHAWWNGLPRSLQEEYTGGKLELASTFTFFFTILYNQLLLLINRPFLSLTPKSLEFKSSLQTCVTASRQIITTLRHQSERKLSVSWPGMLSVPWMAGLVLSFASTLKLYPFSKARREIEDCIDQLAAMDRSWNNGKHCAEALKSMSENLQKQFDSNAFGGSPNPATAQARNRGLSTPSNVDGLFEGGATSSKGDTPTRKRRRLDSQEQRGSAEARNELHGASDSRAGFLQQPRLSQDFDPDLGIWSSFENGAALPNLDYSTSQFGMGTPALPDVDNSEYLRLPLVNDLYANIPGAFGNIGWEAMANGAGYINDWNSWSTPRF